VEGVSLVAACREEEVFVVSGGGDRGRDGGHGGAMAAKRKGGLASGQTQRGGRAGPTQSAQGWPHRWAVSWGRWGGGVVSGGWAG